MPDENQKQYELTLILSPDLNEGEIISLEEEIKKNIETLGGSLKKIIGKPEKRSLAYPIKKFQYGYHVSVYFFLAPQKLEELCSIFKHKKEILRYLIVLVPEEKPLFTPRKKLGEGDKKPLAVETVPFVKTKKAKGDKIQLEDLDKKLDEILGV